MIDSARGDAARLTGAPVERIPVVDAHVHFWDPRELHYPWLGGIPALDRPFLPPAYATASREAPVDRIVFVECNCRPAESGREVELVERLTRVEPRIAGVVAFADLTDAGALDAALDALSAAPLVKGVRQNIQGQPAGFALERAFLEGVASVGRRGLTFDLCATHDQLGDLAELVRRCPGTRFVLDHCGKPAIRDRRFEPWARDVARLAARDNVYCKLSGLLTEADTEVWCESDLVPYATHVLACFGTERVMYGSDWPVLTLAGRYADWYGFTRWLTAAWSPAGRRRFYCDNAVRFYGL